MHALSDFERRRLQAVEQLNLVDAAPDPHLDRLVGALAALLAAPAAVVTLVASDRIWFLARTGLELHEAPRRQSICSHTIEEPEMLVIPDVDLAPRFVGAPFADGVPRFRAYACAVLRSPEGFAIGTVCVLHSEVRRLDERDLNVLREFTRLIEAEISALSERKHAAIPALSRPPVDQVTGLPAEACAVDHLRQRLASGQHGSRVAVHVGVGQSLPALATTGLPAACLNVAARPPSPTHLAL